MRGQAHPRLFSTRSMPVTAARIGTPVSTGTSAALVSQRDFPVNQHVQYALFHQEAIVTRSPKTTGKSAQYPDHRANAIVRQMHGCLPAMRRSYSYHTPANLRERSSRNTAPAREIPCHQIRKSSPPPTAACQWSRQHAVPPASPAAASPWPVPVARRVLPAENSSRPSPVAAPELSRHVSPHQRCDKRNADYLYQM